MVDGNFDYETFKAEFDNIPELKNIVNNFDSRGITLKTREKPEPTQGADKGTGKIDAMAKSAAAKQLKQPG
jgi:hypothetical protein